MAVNHKIQFASFPFSPSQQDEPVSVLARGGGADFSAVALARMQSIISGMEGGPRRSNLSNSGDDVMIDRSTSGTARADTFRAGDGDDVIRTRWGKDTVMGGDGDDLIVSRADAGEPRIAQDSSLSPYNRGQPFNSNRTDDKFTGGDGADTFFFRMDLNARPEIIAKHTDESGEVDWHGVAGENGAAHLHWVEGIGTDKIMDYSKAEGDKIKIAGHTAEIDITYADLNRDGKVESIIAIRSNQGGAGSHDGDSLGKIIVCGDRVEEGDVAVDAGVHFGVYGSVDDMAVA
jgi:Ca2+-binding RTX toxin-like protein